MSIRQSQILPADYAERVYAGWLGKCIGVRFGAPLENWTYEDIRDHLGELEWYAREDRGKVFKPDDDTAVPMILIRACQDYGVPPTADQLGQTVLNYVADQRGTFWWGGYGVSTEHTAYLNLANGIPAPRSGSMEQNGAIVAEQIGGQIFSDIWGLIAPNDPASAAQMAERASSVAHGGNGIYGGRFIAAMVSAAFSESDPRRLIEIGLGQIPSGSEYARVVRAMCDYHAAHPGDWRAAFEHLKANFGYDRYPGVVHIIPNAGVVALGLLYGEGDFTRTIRITNMCGWDTDCNVGNVGAIIGVAVGVNGIDRRWREPMNDLLIAASLIGTRNLLTIPACVDLFVNIARQRVGEPEQTAPRYHFRYPGSTCNFEAEGDRGRPIHLEQVVIDGQPALRVSIRKLNKKGEIRLFTRTVYHPSDLGTNNYAAQFTPLIFPGQKLRARIYVPQDAPVELRAGLYVYEEHSQSYCHGEAMPLTPGQWHTLTFTIPALTDAYLGQAGVVLRTVGDEWTIGSMALAEMDWSGAPDYETTFVQERPETGAITGWTHLRGYWRLEKDAEGCVAFHGSGVGECEAYTGDINWTDYTVTTEFIPLVGEHHNLNVRVQGALRSYAFGLASGGRFVYYRKDGQHTELGSAPFVWQHGKRYRLTVTARGEDLTAEVRGEGGSAAHLICSAGRDPYLSGQVGFSTWHGGHTRFLSLEVRPAREG
jgi:ADP-ribosylglycohydrolase